MATDRYINKYIFEVGPMKEALPIYLPLRIVLKPPLFAIGRLFVIAFARARACNNSPVLIYQGQGC